MFLLRVLLVGGMAISANCFALPSGTYVGTGNMVLENGEVFTYPAKYIIDESKHEVGIEYGDNEAGFSLLMSYNMLANHRVALSVDGKPGGSGYCLKTSCHFDMDFIDPKIGANRISATFFWDKDGLIVNGKSLTDNFTYEDVLKLRSSP